MFMGEWEDLQQVAISQRLCDLRALREKLVKPETPSTRTLRGSATFIYTCNFRYILNSPRLNPTAPSTTF